MIPFFRPNMGAAEQAAAINCIGRGWLTSGPKMREFESLLSDKVRAPYVVAVNSNTAGLHLTLLTLNLKSTDEVIVPAITFVASAETVKAVGARVVLCDVDFNTRNMTLDTVIAAWTPNTKALMLVHFAGEPPKDYEAICDWADSKGVKVIEDAAHTFGARYYDGEPVGSSTRSYATVFSFYATKCITTGGEGGAVATSHAELADKLKVLRLHGISRDVFDRYSGKTSQWEYDVVAEGWKYNMPDISAAVGAVQLQKSDLLLGQRRDICSRYVQGLVPDLLPQSMNWESHCFHLFTVWTPSVRNVMIQYMFDHGVSASMHFKPLYRLSAYAAPPLPESERYWLGGLSLPLFPGMTEDEVSKVIQVTNDAYHAS